MDKFSALLNKISQHDQYKILLAMKHKIESSEVYLSRYQEVLELQKQLVSLETLGDTLRSNQKRESYSAKLNELTNDILVNEYLNALDEFSQLIHDVEEIINHSINH